MVDKLNVHRIQRSADWLQQALEVTKGNGVSAWYHPFRGWGPAYPETTGYLLPTMLKLAQYFKDPVWEEHAHQCCQWLMRVQNADGGFPAIGGGRSLIFDTGMILEGFCAMIERGNRCCAESAQRALAWLAASRCKLGWDSKQTYSQGFVPDYLFRVIWWMIRMDAFFPGIINRKSLVLEWRCRYDLLSDPGEVWPYDLGFDQHGSGWLHTWVYAVRGFFETSCLLGQIDSYLSCLLKQLLLPLFGFYQHQGHLPGVFVRGKAKKGYRNPVGECQLACLLQALTQVYDDPFFQMFYRRVIHEMAPLNKSYLGKSGGIWGTQPALGPYQRLRQINWGVKFYLDAFLPVYELNEKKIRFD